MMYKNKTTKLDILYTGCGLQASHWPYTDKRGMAQVHRENTHRVARYCRADIWQECATLEGFAEGVLFHAERSLLSLNTTPYMWTPIHVVAYQQLI